MEKETKDELDKKEHVSGYFRFKKFHFIMLVFIIIFATAGITTFALSFGDEKAVNVGTKSRTEFNELYSVYDKINQKYYKDLDNQTLIDGAINGMVESLGDPYSDYMTKKEASQFNETISSSFEGIGAEIQQNKGNIVIVSPIKGSPAEKAGLKPNDKVLKVNNTSLQGKSANEAVLLIRGEKGTKVTLTIMPAGSTETKKLEITRDTIPIETVYSSIDKNKTATIQITTFSENTSKEFATAVNNMKEQGMKALIVDVRQDPGGLLDEAINIANMFVPAGKVIVQEEDKNGKIAQQKANDSTKIDVPTAVLIDSGSASASEILAAALNQSAGIPLVGEKSFGKGTVQQPENLNDGASFKITVAKWLTPNGSWIHEKGIQPTYKVNLPDYANLPVLDTTKKIKNKDMSTDVKTAEQMLDALGYNPGNIDGFFDENTLKAVEKFQKDQKLKQDGIITGKTTAQLILKLQHLIQKNDTQSKKAATVLEKKVEQK